jgi:spore maturation protein SpmB
VILVLGLLAIAFFLLTLGGTVLYWIHIDHPALSQLPSNHSPDEIRSIMSGVVAVGIFLALCASYIWSHP